MFSLKIDAITRPDYTKLNSNKLEWNVFVEDFNRRDIVVYNIFQHGGFSDALQKIAKQRPSKEVFADLIRCQLSYYFWSKSEYEVIVTSWPAYISQEELCRLIEENESSKYPNKKLNVCPEVGEKIDIYTQVMLNFKLFVDYTYKKLIEDVPVKKKRTYNRTCGSCGEKNEQSQMIRTNESPNGWLCCDCYERMKGEDVWIDD